MKIYKADIKYVSVYKCAHSHFLSILSPQPKICFVLVKQEVFLVNVEISLVYKCWKGLEIEGETMRSLTCGSYSKRTANGEET